MGGIIMKEKGRLDFCTVCRKEAEYTLKKRDIIKTIKNREYTFNITVAVCNECGEEMSLPGLIDKNIQEVDEKRAAFQEQCTSTRWGDGNEYDLCINTGIIGIEYAVEMILEYIRFENIF